MADSRSIRAKKNIVVSLLCQVVTLICGFIVPKLLLSAFGLEIYGATASIVQFLAYITLLEGGVGGVARAVLYKPLAENNQTAISAILAELRRFFRVIAGIFGVYVVILACSFKSISGLAQMDQLSTVLLVLVISISTFGQYFIGISNSILLQAAQRSYITNFVNLIGTIVNTVVTVALVLLQCNIIAVKLVSSLIFLLKPIVLWLYVRKHYQISKTSRSAQKHLTQKWSGLGQHIAYFLHSNTDVVVLTCLASLKDVAVYSVYNMVISHIQNLAVSFVSGMEALFGDMLAKEEQKQLHETFDLYEMMISIVSVILFSAVAVLILPFVKLYTSGITDTNYREPVFALLLTISALLYCLRMPYHSLVIAAGHFRQTNVAAYGEAAINIVFSVLLVSRMGLVGVAIGTICATGFHFAYYMIYLSKHIFYRNMHKAIKRTLINALTVAAILFVGTITISIISITNYLLWIICGCVVVLLALVITAAVNWLFYRLEFKNAIYKMIPGKTSDKTKTE